MVCAAVWISCIALSCGANAAERLAPAKGNQVASLRLIALPGLSGGRYEAGVEIAMPPGSHTYWKQPGEAGVPPVFAFNGSTNAAKAEIKFPAPSRISEEGIEAFGYTDHVVFPVEVIPKDAGLPVELKVVVDYAVCNKICVPAHGAANMILSPAGEGLDGAALKTALAEVPLPLSAPDADKLKLVPEKSGSKPSWSITWSGATPVEDIFADPPAGFYFDTKKTGPNQFKLTAVQVVSAAKTAQVPISLMLKQKTGGLVANETGTLKF